MTDAAWGALEPLLTRDASQPGRRIDPDRLREYVDAILYVLRTGCPWRHLPHDFSVEWSASHQQFMRCPGIAKVWADKGYTGPATRGLAAKTGIDIEIVTGPKPPPGTGFLVQPRRWVVERTHAWINRNRRMVRQWEATLEAHTGFLILSQIAAC